MRPTCQINLTETVHLQAVRHYAGIGRHHSVTSVTHTCTCTLIPRGTIFLPPYDLSMCWPFCMEKLEHGEVGTSECDLPNNWKQCMVLLVTCCQYDNGEQPPLYLPRCHAHICFSGSLYMHGVWMRGSSEYPLIHWFITIGLLELVCNWDFH